MSCRGNCWSRIHIGNFRWQSPPLHTWMCQRSGTYRSYSLLSKVGWAGQTRVTRMSAAARPTGPGCTPWAAPRSVAKSASWSGCCGCCSSTPGHAPGRSGSPAGPSKTSGWGSTIWCSADHSVGSALGSTASTAAGSANSPIYSITKERGPLTGWLTSAPSRPGHLSLKRGCR
jgi:hypothetical protein